jgi:hypothetical protein
MRKRRLTIGIRYAADKRRLGLRKIAVGVNAFVQFCLRHILATLQTQCLGKN